MRKPTQGESTRLIVRNSAFNVLGMALIVPLNFIALFTLARRLGQESLGVFFTLFAVSAVIFLVCSAGVGTVLMRRIAQRPEDIRQTVSQAAGVLMLIATASVSLLVAFCVVAAPWLLDQRLTGALVLWAAISLAARHTLELAAAALRGAERFEFENVARVLQTGWFCIAVLALVKSGPAGSLWAFIAYGTSNLAAASFLIAILVFGWGCRSITFNLSVCKRWLSESWPVGAGDVFRQAGWQMETLALAAMQHPAAVGLYSIAYRPLQPLQMLPRALVSVTFPSMSRMAVSNRQRVASMVGESTVLLWALGLPVAMIITLTAGPLVLATAGPEYADAALPLQLLIWVTGFTFVNTQSRFVFTAMGWERTYWMLTMGILVPKLLIACALIPLLGIYGACVSCLTSEFLLAAAGLYVLSMNQCASIPWARMIRATIGAGFITAIMIPLAQVHASLPFTALMAAGSVVIFFGYCIALRVIPWNQLAGAVEVLGDMVSRFLSRPSVAVSATTVGENHTNSEREKRGSQCVHY